MGEFKQRVMESNRAAFYKVLQMCLDSNDPLVKERAQQLKDAIGQSKEIPGLKSVEEQANGKAQ